MHWVRTGSVGAGLIALTVAACGGGELPPELADGPDAADPDTIVYDCFGVEATLAQLEEAPAVAELDHAGVDAFADSTDELDGWRAVVVEEDRLAAIRALDPPDELDGEVRDHERLELTLLDEPAPPESDEDGWLVSSSGPCALRPDLGGLGSAAVHLDDEAPMDADSSQLDLLVVEQACASGDDASGRVVVDVDADADEVRLLVGVEPRSGDQTCPSNPPTPVTVDLDEPLGDRAVMDVGRYPPLEVAPAPQELWRGD